MPIQFSNDPMINFQLVGESNDGLSIYQSCPFDLIIDWDFEMDPSMMSLKLVITDPIELEFSNTIRRYRYGYPHMPNYYVFSNLIFQIELEYFDNLSITGVHMEVFWKLKEDRYFSSMDDSAVGGFYNISEVNECDEIEV